MFWHLYLLLNKMCVLTVFMYFKLYYYFSPHSQSTCLTHLLSVRYWLNNIWTADLHHMLGIFLMVVWSASNLLSKLDPIKREMEIKICSNGESSSCDRGALWYFDTLPWKQEVLVPRTNVINFKLCMWEKSPSQKIHCWQNVACSLLARINSTEKELYSPVCVERIQRHLRLELMSNTFWAISPIRCHLLVATLPN